MHESANGAEQSRLDRAAAVLRERDRAGTSGERRYSTSQAVATGLIDPFQLCSGSWLISHLWDACSQKK